jgi:hypothetical protein
MKLTKRKGFNFFRSYYDVYNELENDADKVAFIEALLDRQFLGIKPLNLTGMAKFAYISQTNSIDSQVKGYEDKTKTFLTPTVGGSVGGVVPPWQQVQVQVKEKVKEKEIYNLLLSEIKISDVEPSLQIYTKIAKVFQETFITNLKEKGASTITQEKATFKNYITPIRLMIENKECTIDDLRDVEKYLSSPQGDFWKSNILSTTTLRKQITKLVMESRKNPVQAPKQQDRL